MAAASSRAEQQLSPTIATRSGYPEMRVPSGTYIHFFLRMNR